RLGNVPGDVGWYDRTEMSFGVHDTVLLFSQGGICHWGYGRLPGRTPAHSYLPASTVVLAGGLGVTGGDDVPGVLLPGEVVPPVDGVVPGAGFGVTFFRGRPRP